MGIVPTKMELILEQTQQGVSHEVSVSAKGVEELKRKVKIKGEKKEALLTLKAETGSIHLLSEILSCCLFDESNANVLERFYTLAGNPVKEILLKLNLLDHRILKDGGEDATLKLFKSTNQERYEHVGPEVISSQDDEVTRWRNEIMLG
ncbi:hypothetical protein Tco_0939644 [Tanacetum coccineum]|uniref:Uncharacterized protein n=1 Tax=Tanacetum coccineum TaxID=301880 RepID=A0ABQ5DRR8_9ASTR